MKHVISLSGGVGSYFTLKRVLEQQKKEDVIAVFCDTLQEDGDLYRFLDDIEEKLNISIIRLCVGKTPTELCFEQNFIFNSRVAICSKELKSKPFRKWLSENYQPDECILYLGIDWTESHRCNAIIKNYHPYKCAFPMCCKPYLSKEEMLNQLKDDGIQIPRMYRLGFSHNNCKGFCFKAGIGHYKKMLEVDPVLFRECENREQMMIQQIRSVKGNEVTYSILKRKGKPFTLRQLREMVENQPQQLTIDECLDFGACGCFVDDDFTEKEMSNNG